MKFFRSSLVFFPALIFILVSLTFYFALKFNNLEELPSNLLHKAVPRLDLEPLGTKSLPTNTDLTTPQVKFVNFWASWCAPCRVEHPMLKKIANLNYPIIGISYKDNPEDALEFLSNLGDPFVKVGADISGRNGLEWGLYGVPETFIIDQNGKIVLRQAGPITKTVFEKKIKPLLD